MFFQIAIVLGAVALLVEMSAYDQMDRAARLKTGEIGRLSQAKMQQTQYVPDAEAVQEAAQLSKTSRFLYSTGLVATLSCFTTWVVALARREPGRYTILIAFLLLFDITLQVLL